MIVSYKNGNYRVFLSLDDGTKIRYNNLDKLTPHRPESIDVKITNQCQHNCVFCHENSLPHGKLASLDTMKHFINTIPAYTEIAVGGGNIMESYNHTEVFLKMLKNVKAIPSITVRQYDFIKYLPIIQEWKEKELIYGIGISYDGASDDYFFTIVKDFPSAVIHVIAGMLTEREYQRLRGHNLKMLILGYKVKGRGKLFWSEQENQIVKNISDLKNHFKDFKNDFNTIAFDNLALMQLDVKNNVSAEIWNKYYCGDDGQYTFYVDLVEEKYAKSSTSVLKYNINQTISVQDMFNMIQGAKNSKENL